MAFRIICVQICIHILNTDELEIESFKEKKKIFSWMLLASLLFEKLK